MKLHPLPTISRKVLPNLLALSIVEKLWITKAQLIQDHCDHHKLKVMEDTADDYITK
jgi:hypothetical protein